MKEFEQMKDLRGQGLNRSEVAEELHLDRKTVRKYWSMSDTQFREYLEKLRRRGLSFDQYKADIIAVYQQGLAHFMRSLRSMNEV